MHMTRKFNLLFLALPVALMGCATTSPNQVLTTDARSIDGGRAVEVSVVQNTIRTPAGGSPALTAAAAGIFAPSVLMAAVVGGVSGAINAHLDKIAEKQSKPLREALNQYDFDAHAQEVSKQALAELGWFHTCDYVFAKEISLDKRSARLDAACSSQVTFIDYDYAMSENFDVVELSVLVSIADRKSRHGYVPIGRLNQENLVYIQKHKMVVPLRNASDDKEENIKRWVMDEGRLIKQALGLGLNSAHILIKKGLAQTADERRTNLNARRIDPAAYHLRVDLSSGRLLEENDDGTLLMFRWPYDVWILVFNPVG